MKTLNKLGCALALAFAAMGSAQASVLMTDWVFNPNGGGFEKGQVIGEYLDINGQGFIQLTPAGPGSFTFTEHAVFNLTQADSTGKLFPTTFPGGNISAIFEATGSGKLNGSFQFTSGTIRMYQNPTNGQYGSTAGIYGANLGKQIAYFDVLAGGGGNVDANGSPISNGRVTVHAEAAAGQLAPGYFFNKDGVDLSTQPMFAFAFTNANTLSNPNSKATPNLVKELACQFANFTGPGCQGKSAYKAKIGEHFFIGGNGQFKLAEVPEPGSVALFGIALAGIGALRRRKAA
ncbi:flocculation-associated PEP-CTERM protein PepA [Massilia sp. GCM10023247]|uniref:flocculation-associated PEP-CTERM protein PepA n=1 Tax=Massilia sp. GCM10023247 TaxID=3252643 RepID=UPI003614202C